MAWSKNSKTDILGETMSILDQVVTNFRNRGHTRAIAMQQAALALDVKPRRARALLYGEAFKVAAEEYRTIRSKYLDHLDAEADALAARFEAIKAKRRQAEMDV